MAGRPHRLREHGRGHAAGARVLDRQPLRRGRGGRQRVVLLLRRLVVLLERLERQALVPLVLVLQASNE